MKTSTITVTGANGYLPSRFIYDLLSKGYRVKGTVRDPNDNEKNGFLKEILPTGSNLSNEALDRFQLVSIPDLKEDNGFVEAFTGSDVVVHAAAPLPKGEVKDPENEVAVPMVNGTRWALEAAVKTGVKKFIYISSAAAIVGKQREKNPQYTFTENDWNDEMGSAYSKGKTQSEKFLWQFARNHPDLDIMVINPTLVLGPILYKRLFSTTESLFNLISGKYLENGAPSNVHGIADIRDVSEAVCKGVEGEGFGKRYIVSSRKNYSYLELADIIEELYPGQFKLPNKIKDNVKVNTYNTAFDNSKIVEFLGRELKDVKESIKDTIDSFKQFGII